MILEREELYEFSYKQVFLFIKSILEELNRKMSNYNLLIKQIILDLKPYFGLCMNTKSNRYIDD